MNSKKKSSNIVNSPKLKGLLVEKNKTYDDCAKVLGISAVQFGKKVRGINDFRLTEIAILSNFLELTAYEFFAIFIPYMLEE